MTASFLSVFSQISFQTTRKLEKQAKRAVSPYPAVADWHASSDFVIKALNSRKIFKKLVNTNSFFVFISQTKPGGPAS